MRASSALTPGAGAGPRRSTVAVGLFYAASALGPALGFVLGGSLLGVYVDPGAATVLTPSAKAWVGAW